MTNSKAKHMNLKGLDSAYRKKKISRKTYVKRVEEIQLNRSTSTLRPRKGACSPRRSKKKR